jgi:hypothetical protein
VLLQELTLQHNRLTSVLLSFASLRHLRWEFRWRELCTCAATLPL